MCRQQSEVSTPNRDVWRVCGRLERFHKRCVKTERRRRGSRRPHSVALRGVFRGFRKKSPKSDVVTVAILFTKSQNVRNLAVLKIDHRFKPPQRNPLKPPTTLSASAAGGGAIVALPQRRNPKRNAPTYAGA